MVQNQTRLFRTGYGLPLFSIPNSQIRLKRQLGLGVSLSSEGELIEYCPNSIDSCSQNKENHCVVNELIKIKSNKQ
jgi:hypothetical protein